VENFSKADELAKLANLRDRGLISEKDFERQRKGLLNQPWDWRRPRSLVGICAAVVIAVGLAGAVVVAGGKTTTPTSTGKVAFTNTAANLGQVQTAVSYAESYVGQNYLPGQCLAFVYRAWSSAGLSIGSSYSALTYWNSDPMKWTEHASPRAYNGAPEGALLFWGATGWNSDGHVAIAVDNSGDVVSTSAYPYYHGVRGSPDVLAFNISQRSASTYNYLGWVMPGGTFPTAPAPISPPPATAPAAPAPTATAPTVTGTPSAPAGTGSVAGTGPVAGTTATQGGGGSISTPAPSSSSSAPQPSGSSSPSPTVTTTTAANTPAPVQASPPPPAPTWTEYAGGPAHTWTNYTNAGGNEGPTIPPNQPVQIACKLPGFTVQDGNTWWYRIAQSPWNNAYYVSADAFYNNGATSGSLHGTPFVDPAVANC
jgi:hypothetical protein